MVDDFSVIVSYEDIQAKNYSLSAGQYFKIKVEYSDITQEEFNKKMESYIDQLTEQFIKGDVLSNEITKALENFKYD